VSGKWFLLDIKQAEEKFNTSSAAGLSRKAAAKLLAEKAKERADRNKSIGDEISSLTDIAKTIVADPSMVILFGLCLISAFTGHAGTMAFILAFILPYIAFVALINILIFLSERKAKKVLVPFSKVRRDGRLYYVKSTGVVAGDLLFLTQGDFIPADALIVSSDGLKVSFEQDGVSVLMSKSSENLSSASNDNIPLFRRSNVLCAGSYVISGTGTAIVAATDNETYAAITRNKAESIHPVSGKNNLPAGKTRTGIARTAFVLNIAAVGFILVYTLLSLFFPFSGAGMFDAFLASAAIAALTSGGLITMSGRAALLSSMLYEDCSFSRGIVLNKSDAASRLADVRTLFVNDKMFVSDGRLNASACYIGGREYQIENSADSVPDDYLRNIAMSIFNEPANAETGFSRNIRYAVALRSLISRSGRKEEDITRGCSLIGYVSRGAASKFDTVVFSCGGKTYRICRTSDESLISSSSYMNSQDGIVPLSPEMSERLHSLYRILLRRGCTVITTAAVVGSSLVLDGMLVFSVNSHTGGTTDNYLKDFADSGVRVIFTSSEANGDVTWYNNTSPDGIDVVNCDAHTRACDILNNSKLVYLNGVSPSLLAELVKEAAKFGGTALANCNPAFYEASEKALVSIYCTQFDTAATIRNDACLPISSVEEEKGRSVHLLANADIVLSQPHNRRGGLSMLEKTFRCVSGKKYDAEAYGKYFVFSFFTRIALMLMFALTGEFLSAPLVIAAGVLTDILALAVLITHDCEKISTEHLNYDDEIRFTGKNIYIQPLVSATVTAVLSFIISRLFATDDSAGTTFLFTAMISSSAALLFSIMGRRIKISPDQNRFLTSFAGFTIILVALIIMTAVRPVARQFGMETSVPEFIAAAAAVPIVTAGAVRFSEWLIKLDSKHR
jgi:hypothetical protein